MPPLDLDHLTRRYESFFQELERELYLEGAGLKTDIRAAEIYERYSDLSSLDLVKALADRLGSLPRDRLLRNLSEATTLAYLGNLTRATDDALLSAESAGTIRLEETGEQIPFRSSSVVMAGESNRERRQAIQDRRDEFVRRTLNPLYEQSSDETWAGIRELGSETYREVVERLSGIDFDSLADLTKGFLRDTEAMYLDVLTFFSRRMLGVDVERLEKHDLGYLARAGSFDHFFEASRMIPTILGCVERMGIDPAAGGRIRLDLEVRPTKSPRAFCSAIQIPDEVYLVIRPSGGIEDYKAFLHELGHALHFAFTESSISWEARRLGDNSVTESYAMLFDHRMLDRHWLHRVMGIPDPADVLVHSAFIELMMLRRYAAKFAYELKLHDSPSRSGRGELYGSLLTDATKVRYSSVHYLADVDPFFYSARYLRAWMLQACASLSLRERFDEDWFINPRTGPALKALWAQGQGLSGEELAKEFGQDRLTMDPLRQSLEHILGG